MPSTTHTEEPQGQTRESDECFQQSRRANGEKNPTSLMGLGKALDTANEMRQVNVGSTSTVLAFDNWPR